MEVVILPAHSPLYEFMKLEQAGTGWYAKDTVDRGIDVPEVDFDLVEHDVNLNNNPGEAILQQIITMGKKNLIAQTALLCWLSV